MKKIFLTMMMLIFCLSNVQASIVYEYEENTELLTREELYSNAEFLNHTTFFGDKEGYITSINNELYYRNDYIRSATYQKVYSIDFFNKLKDTFKGFFQYEKTDNGYIVCEPAYRIGMQTYGWSGGNKIAYLYNDNFESTKEYKFDTLIYSVDYFNSSYYVELVYGGDKINGTIESPKFKFFKSNDFVNWEECDEPQKNGDVVYENGVSKYRTTNMGLLLYGASKIEQNDGVFGVTYTYKGYYSPNGIYSIDMPEIYGNDLIWEDNDYIYCLSSNRKLQINKQSLLNEINALEQLPIIKLNGKILGFEQPPVVEQDRTLVPIRFLFEQMGASVDWDEATETATVAKDEQKISFQIGNESAKVNNAAKMMDVPARLINDKTMVPLRFLSENLGYNVNWDEATKMVTIIIE